jgi:hypothetical protein
MLWADAPMNVIQVEWQALAALGSILGGALVASAKILAAQWEKSNQAVGKRHDEARQDTREARDENRALSQAILAIQSKTVETLTGLQREIEHVVIRLDRLEGTGSKTHAATPR